MIVEGTNEGLAAARARGVRLGRPPALTPEQIQHARTLLTAPDNSVSSIARLLRRGRIRPLRPPEHAQEGQEPQHGH